MAAIRYRRTSVRTALGITKEEKRIKREVGITALLRPFRWWGNEKRKIKRDVGYYSPEAKFARHVLPHSVGKMVRVLIVVGIVVVLLGWLIKPAVNPATTAIQSESNQSSR